MKMVTSIGCFGIVVNRFFQISIFEISSFDIPVSLLSNTQHSILMQVLFLF